MNLVLAPLSDRMDEGIHDGLRAALDASPAGAVFAPLPLVCGSLIRV